MPTNDERRRLADNMLVFDVVGDGRGRYWLNGTLFGMDVSARSEEGLRNGMAYLASFIEPDAIPDKPDETGRPLSEPEIDREALLALADEFEDWAEECRKYYAETEQQGLIGEASAYRDCANRIREAVGA